MIKIAVCDDEPYMLDGITLQLAKYLDSKSLSHRILRYESGAGLLDGDMDFDILFIDIQMEAPDGMEIARRLRERGFDGLIIFTTILKEHVFDSFEVEAFDYLIKPHEDARLFHTLDRALNTLEKKLKETITIHRANTCRVLPLEQIVYCEVLGRKIFLHTRDGETTDFYGTLDELEQNVDSRFFRCHRSYLINLDYVLGLKNGNVILPDNGTIPVSRLREPQLSQALLSHMKKRRR